MIYLLRKKMNLTYYGDSYDLVKRFFCLQLKTLKYKVVVDPTFTDLDDWTIDDKQKFFLLIGARPANGADGKKPSALFIDPDTGVREKRGTKHVTFERLAEEIKKHALVFAFDQAFSRGGDVGTAMRSKFSGVAKRGACYCMYYTSHAHFLFVALKKEPLDQFREHLVELGLPALDSIAEASERSGLTPVVHARPTRR